MQLRLYFRVPQAGPFLRLKDRYHAILQQCCCVQPSETNGDMLNLVDDEPQPLANGHASKAPETGPAIEDPMAELMGLNLGGQSSATVPNHAQPGSGSFPFIQSIFLSLL